MHFTCAESVYFFRVCLMQMLLIIFAFEMPKYADTGEGGSNFADVLFGWPYSDKTTIYHQMKYNHPRVIPHKVIVSNIHQLVS